MSEQENPPRPADVKLSVPTVVAIVIMVVIATLLILKAVGAI